MDFELIMRFFVYVWIMQNGEFFDFIGQRDWVMYISVSVFCSVNDFLSVGVQYMVIESFQLNVNVLILYFVSFFQVLELRGGFVIIVNFY